MQRMGQEPTSRPGRRLRFRVSLPVCWRIISKRIILRCRMRSGDILVRRGSTRIERATDNRHPTPTEWRITIEDNE